MSALDLTTELEAQLEDWQAVPEAVTALFGAADAERLDQARRAAAGPKRTVAFCAFENPFARAGGLFAVASFLPPALRDAGDDVVLLTPFHRNLATTPPYHELSYLTEIQVPLWGGPRKADLFERYDALGNRWVFIQAWEVFDAPGGPDAKNPYAHADSFTLLRDALFFSQAVPQALAHLGYRENLIVHAHDWQTAPTALSVKEALLRGDLDSAAVVLTSHNPYDHPLPPYNLNWVTDRTASGQWPLGRDTVYQRMIPLTDAPLSTVSPGFADELTSDPLQTRHFAHHLQSVFASQGVVGIDNPLFGVAKAAFSEAAVGEAGSGAPRKILAEKAAKRRKMLEVLSAYDDPRIRGGLDGGAGKPLTELPDDVPVFMMFGRLDPGQKGFDLMARAIEGFPRGEAKFILTPVVGPGTERWTDDLLSLASRREGDVAVYPFRMEQGYMEAMAGASFAVMPSFYEPFGAATEAYLAGTPVVARATGGLIGQVVDHRQDSFKATGVLFREKLPLGSSWPAIEKAAGPEDRAEIPLYALMAEALLDSLEQAAEIYRKRESLYARMLANLFKKASMFSAERAAAGYRALYDAAVRDEPRL